MQRTPSSGHRFIHLRLAGFCDMSDQRSIRGIYIREFALSGHKTTIDIVLD
jgi:hypothetical protein